MPKKKEIYEYVRDFYWKMNDKYKSDSVTPDIYSKEVLNYIKKLDSDFDFIKMNDFLNGTALSMVNDQTSAGCILAEDKTLAPFEFNKGLMEHNMLSPKVYKAMNSAMSKDAYVKLCNDLKETKGLEGGDKALIEYKMNAFKMVENLKPTGNKFTNFFKKLFNINGYNDKLAAYEDCKQSVKDLVGDSLTAEEFEEHIHSQERFFQVNQTQKAKRTQLEINDLDNEKVEIDKTKVNNQPVIEKVKEVNK